MNRLIHFTALLVGACLARPVFGDVYSDFNQAVAQYNAAAGAWNNGSGFFPQINSTIGASIPRSTRSIPPRISDIPPSPPLPVPIRRSISSLIPAGIRRWNALIPPVGPYDSLAGKIANGTTDRLTFNQFVASFNPQLEAWEAAAIAVFPAWEGSVNVEFPPAQQLARHDRRFGSRTRLRGHRRAVDRYRHDAATKSSLNPPPPLTVQPGARGGGAGGRLHTLTPTLSPTSSS